MDHKLNNKQKILLIFTIIVFFFTIFGATFSYIKVKRKLNSDANFQTLTNTTDSLLFNGGENINIEATYDNFGDVDRKNLMGETKVGLVLKSNNTTNSATTTYCLFLSIMENDFVYTTDVKQAELLLQIIDPEGNEIKSLPGYNYVTSEGSSGFDITEARETILFTNSYSITSGIEDATQEWTVRVILVNLPTDQEGNTGKHFDANVRIDKNIYLADHLKWNYDSSSHLYHHDETLKNGANDGSYRFAGASAAVKNYICFGSDADVCPDTNLYRIIGVFGNNVKLIKNTSIGAYTWSGGTSSTAKNNWNASTLNKTTLNGTTKGRFLYDLGTEWSDKIIEATWYVGGYSDRYMTPKTFYDYEVGVNKTDTTYSAKIGLMYVSDYGFAATPSYWTTNLSSYSSSAYNNDWLNLGSDEWTITRDSGSTYEAYSIYSNRVYDQSIYSSSYTYAVRPVFYLDYPLHYVGGTGTQTDPIRIDLK